MRVPHGYYHRSVPSSPEWVAGIPPTLSQVEIEDSFEQLSPSASLLNMTDLQYQSTHHIGATNATCVQFVTTSGDLFKVTIPSNTVYALQAEVKPKKLPELRIARLALEWLVDQGIPEIEVALKSVVFEVVKSRLTQGA